VCWLTKLLGLMGFKLGFWKILKLKFVGQRWYIMYFYSGQSIDVCCQSIGVVVRKLKNEFCLWQSIGGLGQSIGAVKFFKKLHFLVTNWFISGFWSGESIDTVLKWEKSCFWGPIDP
jgi:hypothetical protein